MIIARISNRDPLLLTPDTIGQFSVAYQNLTHIIQDIKNVPCTTGKRPHGDVVSWGWKNTADVEFFEHLQVFAAALLLLSFTSAPNVMLTPF